MFSSSSASKMSHLVVRRPPGILGTSREDFVPPAFKNDKVPNLSQGLSSSGVGARPSRGVGVLPHVGRVEIHCPKTNSIVEPFSFLPRPALADGERSRGDLDDDREELLFAADFARNASYRACSDSFWKKMECYFAPVTPQNESYLKHQLEFADATSGNSHRVAEGEDAIIKHIVELEAGLVQQGHKKKKYIRKIYESVQDGKDAEKRNVEQAAMKKLVEMAYKRQRVSHIRHSSKRVLRRVSKEAALPFVERTLAKCREFEDTGRSCFRKAALQDIIFSTPKSNSVPNSFDTQASGSAKTKYRSSPTHNLQPKGSGSRDKQQYKERNRDLMPNDVSSDSSRAMPDGSVKGNRSMTSVPPIVPNDGMQDQDWQGLDIPMDDLKDVNFGWWF